jgi:hypothetical protein
VAFASAKVNAVTPPVPVPADPEGLGLTLLLSLAEVLLLIRVSCVPHERAMPRARAQDTKGKAAQAS